MNDPQFVFSIPEREKTLSYLSLRSDDSLLMHQLGTGFPYNGRLTLVTNGIPPADVDYFDDWTGSWCTDWLISEIANHLKQTPNSVVLFEDSTSMPPFVFMQEHPPFWRYVDRLFWPLTAKSDPDFSPEDVIAWAAPRTTAVFATLPNDVSSLLDREGMADGRQMYWSGQTKPGPRPGFESWMSPRQTHLLSTSEFDHIGRSTTRLVTEVFDGGGFLMWEKDN